MLRTTTRSRRAAWREGHAGRLRRTDAAALLTALGLTQFVRLGAQPGELALGGAAVPSWTADMVLGAVWWWWLDLRGSRDVGRIGTAVEEVREVVTATLVLFGALAVAAWALAVPLERSHVVIALPLGTALLLAGRGIVRRGPARRQPAGETMSRTLVVGREPEVREMLRFLRERPVCGLEPVAVCAPAAGRPLPAPPPPGPVLPNTLPAGEPPTVDGILAACRAHYVETVVLAASAPLSSEQLRHLGWHLADARVRLVLDTGLTDVAGPRIRTRHLAGRTLIHVSTPHRQRSRQVLKRSVDIAGAGAALLLLAPAMLVLAAIVRTHDGGPALFAQERIGRNGSRFRMLKFRSMHPEAEARRTELLAANDAKGGVMFFMADDPRVTGPGRWMRRHSLDELPQFLNVLKGDMSLVGPRPPLPSEVERYEGHVHRRLRVTPGITGLWQISGRDDLDWEQAVRLDLYYVENWSPVQDLVIILRTVRAVLRPQGAH